MSISSSRPNALTTMDTLLLTTVFTGATWSVVPWAGAAITEILSGHPVPEVDLVTEVLAVADTPVALRARGDSTLGQPGCTEPRHHR